MDKKALRAIEIACIEHEEMYWHPSMVLDMVNEIKRLKGWETLEGSSELEE